MDAKRAVLGTAAAMLMLLTGACSDDGGSESPSPSTTTTRVLPVSGFDPVDLEQRLQPSVGLPLAEFESVAAQLGLTRVRVLEEDGVRLGGNDDIRSDRVNVRVEDGRVAGIEGVY